MASIADDIDAQVTRVAAIVDVPVTGDPRVAINAKGGVAVLVEPPTRDYNAVLQTWQLAVVRLSTDVGLDTTRVLSAVVAQLEADPDFPIEEARPGARRLGLDRPAVPAYFIRYTTP